MTEAEALRIVWMTQAGMTPAQIEDWGLKYPPVSLAEEQKFAMDVVNEAMQEGNRKLAENRALDMGRHYASLTKKTNNWARAADQTTAQRLLAPKPVTGFKPNIRNSLMLGWGLLKRFLSRTPRT